MESEEMGLLVDGIWHDEWYDTSKTGGRFERSKSQFRDWVTRDGQPAEGRERGFKAEPGRYHLYVSYACPWAHRTLILRKLKKLEDVISYSVVHHFMGENGWTFRKEDGATGDDLYGLDFLHQIYTKADPHYSGRVTVPVLWDRISRRIVSNDSLGIARMLESAFDGFGSSEPRLRPRDLVTEIDVLGGFIGERLNLGVYRAGFAIDQKSYDQAVASLFEALDVLEDRTYQGQWLLGERMTEVDIRLFVTLIRFDLIYHTHFKCNWRHAYEYPRLWSIVRRLYAIKAVAETTRFDEMLAHYYRSHKELNPRAIVPRGPDVLGRLTG
jgi:glutathionyl-hydroquinone reductase